MEQLSSEILSLIFVFKIIVGIVLAISIYVLYKAIKSLYSDLRYRFKRKRDAELKEKLYEVYWEMQAKKPNMKKALIDFERIIENI